MKIEFLKVGQVARTIAGVILVLRATDDLVIVVSSNTFPIVQDFKRFQECNLYDPDWELGKLEDFQEMFQQRPNPNNIQQSHAELLLKNLPSPLHDEVNMP